MNVKISEEKRKLIAKYWDDMDALENAPESEVELYRQYVEELVAKRDPWGLKIKAFACSYGNRAFKMDTKYAEKTMLHLLKVDDDPFIAEMLGDLYYYGVNKPVNYKKAFHYYALATLGEEKGAKKKIADMIRNGEGVNANRDISHKLYYDLYIEEKYDFMFGKYDNDFAELAFYMGEDLSLISDDPKDVNDVYNYYLIAKTAMKLKEQKYKLNDEDENIKEYLDDALDDAYIATQYAMEEKIYFWNFSSIFDEWNDGNIVIGKFTKLDNSTYEVDIERENKTKFLFLFPTKGICKFVKSIKLVISNVTLFKSPLVSDKDKSFTLIFNNLDFGNSTWRKFGDPVFTINPDAVVDIKK